MTNQWIALLAGVLLLITTGLLIAAYLKVRRQNFLIRVQSREIEKKIRELTQQNEASEQLIREKKQLVMLVSHDLKGPFNRIYALMQLLEMGSNRLTDDQKEYLGKMYQVVGDGLNMVRNLVDVRRLEERGMDPHPERIDLAYLVTSIVNQYNVTAGKKKITIHLESPEKLEFVTDKNFVARILENLLSNAIKFSPVDKRVYVTVSEEEKAASISVRDEGPGISREDQQKLFQRFQKLTARPTGGESSTGIGLSIVKMLVTSMNGEIICESDNNNGSTFRLRIPQMKLKEKVLAAGKLS
jgi:two-component system sensor histidine kinase/response regulator